MCVFLKDTDNGSYEMLVSSHELHLNRTFKMKIRLLNESMEFAQVKIFNKRDPRLTAIISANELNSRQANRPNLDKGEIQSGFQLNSQKSGQSMPGIISKGLQDGLVLKNEKNLADYSRNFEPQNQSKQADRLNVNRILSQSDSANKLQHSLARPIKPGTNFLSNVEPARVIPPTQTRPGMPISNLNELTRLRSDNKLKGMEGKYTGHLLVDDREMPRGRPAFVPEPQNSHSQILTENRKNSSDQKPSIGIRKSSNKCENDNETFFNFDQPELNEIFEAWDIVHRSSYRPSNSLKVKADESATDIVFSRKQNPLSSELKKKVSPPAELSEDNSGCKRLKKIHKDEPQPVFCPICYTDNGEGSYVKINSCTHPFCYPCIMEWSKITNTCPLCKQEFTEISVMEKEACVRKEKVEAKRQVHEEELNSEEELIANADNFCYFCEGTNDENYLLICDHCNLKCCHTFCLNPPLQFVPQDEWYCDYCFRNFGVRGNNPIAGIFGRNGRSRRRQRQNAQRTQPQRNASRRNRRGEQSQNSSIDELSQPNTRTFARSRTARVDTTSNEDFNPRERELRPTRSSRNATQIRSQGSEREAPTRPRNNQRTQTNQDQSNNPHPSIQMSDQDLDMLFSGDIDTAIGVNNDNSNRKRKLYLSDDEETVQFQPNRILNDRRRESRDRASNNDQSTQQGFIHNQPTNKNMNSQPTQPNQQTRNRPNVNQFLAQNQTACDTFIDDIQLRKASLEDIERFRYQRNESNRFIDSSRAMIDRQKDHIIQSIRHLPHNNAHQNEDPENKVNALNFSKAYDQLNEQHKRGGEFRRRR